jgi:subtilisin family serine protease
MNQKTTPSKGVKKIVTLQEQGDFNLLKQTLERAGGQIIKKLPLVDGYLCEFPSEDNVLAAVRSNEELFQVEDDLEFKLCWLPQPFYQAPAFAGSNRVGWGLKRIGAPQVWNKLKERRIRVGIIDTGIDYNHPDLQNNFKEGISTLDGRQQFLDDYGHGTHVAGIIGSAGQKYGSMTGINPYVDIYVVKAFNKEGKGNLSDIIEGLDWLARRQIDIINMSFSTNETNKTFAGTIQYLDNKGITMVAAAGNDGGSNSVNYPARFTQVLAVSATDRYDRIAQFSSTGPEIDFCAPGVEILSAWVGGGYEMKSGTSFAAPHITGTVADLLNIHGSMPSRRVKEIMAGGAVRISHLNSEQQGVGMVELPRIIR